MSRGLITVLVLGGAGFIAFFLFGRRANASQGGRGIDATDGMWPPGEAPAGWNPTNTVQNLHLGLGGGKTPANTSTTKWGLGGFSLGLNAPPPPPGPTGVSNPTYPVQPLPTNQWQGQLGNPVALNPARALTVY